MHHFEYRDGELHAEDVPVSDLADRFGTPLYIYSHATLTRHIRVIHEAFTDLPHLVAYSVKANPALAVIRLLSREGAGADIVSGGELARVLEVGMSPERIVFSGVGKQREEMAAALDAGILCFNVEVAEELATLDELARERGVRAPVAIRVNPDVEAGTHDYIATGSHANKFGIPWTEAPALYDRAAALPGIEVVGVDCHIGSQLTHVEPFVAALARIRELVESLRAKGIDIRYVDVGGGLGVRYQEEEPPTPEEYARAVASQVGDLGATIILEPGRVIAANAGILVARVLYRKEIGGKRFVIVDAAMNDLLRPALYGAEHDVVAVREKTDRIQADVVGPICESGDFLARGREVPDARAGDLIAVMSCGAYSRSMSSNYNSRPRAAEVLVRGGEAHLIGERESVRALFSHERVPEFLREEP